MKPFSTNLQFKTFRHTRQSTQNFHSTHCMLLNLVKSIRDNLLHFKIIAKRQIHSDLIYYIRFPVGHIHLRSFLLTDLMYLSQVCGLPCLSTYFLLFVRSGHCDGQSNIFVAIKSFCYNYKEMLQIIACCFNKVSNLWPISGVSIYFLKGTCAISRKTTTWCYHPHDQRYPPKDSWTLFVLPPKKN